MDETIARGRWQLYCGVFDGRMDALFYLHSENVDAQITWRIEDRGDLARAAAQAAGLVVCSREELRAAVIAELRGDGSYGFIPTDDDIVVNEVADAILARLAPEPAS